MLKKPDKTDYYIGFVLNVAHMFVFDEDIQFFRKDRWV